MKTYNVMYIHREAEALLSFKKASYDAPAERSETPWRSFPRVETATSETDR
jgi:hypothetical protein